MKRVLVFLAVITALVAFFYLLPEPEAPQPGAWPEQAGNSFMLRDVNVFSGERMVGQRDVLVVDGVIAQVNPRLPLPDGVPEFAARDHTLMPALFDAHTHNFGTSRVDALRFGVGTQIDMFSSAADLATEKAERESLEATAAADVWSAGTLVTAAGGHGTQFGVRIPTLDDADDAEAFIAARVAEGSDFIKLVLEHGEIVGQDLPTLGPETLTRAIAAAKSHGKLAVVHVLTQAEAATAVAAGADGLVHLFGDHVIEQPLLDAIRDNGVFVIPTLTILESVSGRASGLEADPRIVHWLTPMQRDGLVRPFPGGESRAQFVDRAMQTVAKLRAAGVTVLAGTDAPNPGTVHGASMHRELELLVQAGLTPVEALHAATAAVADAFGIRDRGRIVRDQRADLVLVAGDPTTDIFMTRDIVATWKNGFRVERTRTDEANAIIPAIDDPSLGTFDNGTDEWQATTDSVQGGTSEVEQSIVNGALVLTGEVRHGSMWPWAGTIRMFSAGTFAPVDASAYSTLKLRARGDGGQLHVLFFSGGSGQTPPVIHEITTTSEWTTVTIDLTAVRGLDPGTLRAIAVVAGPAPRRFRFELDSVVLR